MRKWTSLALSLLLTLSLVTPATTTRAAEDLPLLTAQTENDTQTNGTGSTENTDYEEGTVLVTLVSPEGTELTETGELSSDQEISVENSWDFGEAETIADTPAEEKEFEDKTLYVSEVSSDSYSTEELMEKLQNEDYVLSVEPNYHRYKLSVDSDTYRNQQWYLDGEGMYQSTSSGIRYESTATLSKSSDPVVAVVDSGVDYTHEDLADHMWVNTYATLSGTYGYDFGDGDSDPMDNDEDGHGTHCAGVISALSDNQTGIAGISNARIMALKIFDSRDEALDSYIINAFNYIYKAQTLGVPIAAINCSWGGTGSTPTSIRTLIEKIGKKGGLFIFAAGNDGTNHDTASKSSPYDLDSDYTVLVGASNTADKKASFSDYGKKSVDLFAPGEMIYSTVNTGVFTPSAYSEESRARLCEYYDGCGTDDINLYTPSELGRSSRSITYLGKTHSGEDFYNNGSSGSVCFTISTRRSTANLELYLDVTELSLNQSGKYTVAFDIGLEENGDLSWTHWTDTSSAGDFLSYDGKTYLRLVNVSGSLQDVSEVYFDNLSIAKPGLSADSFGKYAFMSGTSMAAPQVSAAVALLASQHASDTAVQRRSRLMHCVRTVSSLSGYCVTGGILDLSKISTAKVTISVKKVTLNKKKATLRYGKKLKLKATVTPKNATNQKVKWSVSNKKYASVTQKGVVRAKKKGRGHTVKVYATAKDGSGKKAYCKIKLKKN